MEVTYEHKPAMTFIGFSSAILPEEGKQKCPEVRDKEYAQKYCGSGNAMLEVYSPGDMKSP